MNSTTDDTANGLDPAAPGRANAFTNGVPGLGRESHAWFALALVAGLVVSVTYVATHDYPAYGSGLYLEIAEQIRAGGYALPTTIPYYDGGIPFAYPPLQFYVVAFLTDLGVSGTTLSLVLPAVVTVLYLVPYYGIALELLPTPRQAGVATAILAVTPPVLQWHLSAGGIVRASAFFLSLCGVYVGARLFRRGTRRPLWVGSGIICFGLTVLSHPTYTVFFGVSWLVLYAMLDRTLPGLVSGAAVALGGLVLAAPWWANVVTTHGVGAFTGAAGSHSGIAGGVGRLLDQFVYPLDPTVVTVFFLASFAATAVLGSRKKFTLPLWLFVCAYVIGKERFQFVAGAMMISTVLFGVVVPRLTDRVRGSLDNRQLLASSLVVVLVVGTSLGGFYAASGLGAAHHGSPSLPSFVDDDDREAMEWARNDTDANASFVVLSDAAELFPHYAKRTMLVGPWGVEWKNPDRYYDQISAFKTASTCENATCVTASMASVDASPDYLYVPRGTYTVRGLEEDGTERLRASLADSPRYRRVYGNDGVVVYEVVSDDTDTDASIDANVDTGTETNTDVTDDRSRRFVGR
ncbi:glycosyltransferase family 39 protein [Haloferax sp. Atlit-12N]|uniref:ArnT family glycosyltransferase n=1 Tax=Haloferax sp. Atlit-12N TaxID=2077203 RepID=UPI001F3DF97F|nr:glycosyltransferase family 39 protein [Haloferax sp. Atlit-12N]